MAFGLSDLLNKLSGKRIQLTSQCGLFREEQGIVKDVFDDFFIFLTPGAQGTFSQRNMVMFNTISIITQLAEVEVDAIDIIR